MPDFAIFEQLQSKVGFAGVLNELGLPSPPSVIAKDERSLREAADKLPVYVKVAFGTATQGLFRIQCADDLEAAIEYVRTQFLKNSATRGHSLQAPGLTQQRYQGYLNLKGYEDFAAENRPRWWTAGLRGRYHLLDWTRPRLCAPVVNLARKKCSDFCDIFCRPEFSSCK